LSHTLSPSPGFGADGAELEGAALDGVAFEAVALDGAALDEVAFEGVALDGCAAARRGNASVARAIAGSHAGERVRPKREIVIVAER
jgi:hypothetical protein